MDDHDILTENNRHNMEQLLWRSPDGKMIINMCLKVYKLASGITSESEIQKDFLIEHTG